MGEFFIEVIIPAPLEENLIYRLPEALKGVEIGCRVTVPLKKNRICIALVVKKDIEKPLGEIFIRDILNVMDEKPVICRQQLFFWEWIASYYLCTLGELFHTLFPKGIFLEKKSKKLSWETVKLSGTLTVLQQEALENIREVFTGKEVCLFQTLSFTGKKQIYLQLIHAALEKKQQVLILVPEPVITKPYLEEFKNAFGEYILTFHSRNTIRHRTLVWKTLLLANGTPYIVVGTKAALFLPFEHLGLIIIENEHDQRYKQHEPAPRYHARSAAIVLAQQHKAKVLLVSPAPSLDSYYNVLNGRYGFVTLPAREGNFCPPEFIVIDIKEERRKKKMRHSELSALLTERIEKARISGVDYILLKSRKEIEKIQSTDFRRVNTVGILCIDTLMQSADFRAHENTFQVVESLIEKAFGSEQPCTVVIQSNQANHPLIEMIVRNDYPAMAKLQLYERKIFSWPPYCRLITVVLRGRNQERLHIFAKEYANRLKSYSSVDISDPVVPIFLPYPTLFMLHIIIKVQNAEPAFPFRLFLKNTRREMLGDTKLSKGILVYHDVDL
ncbi:MAG: hypothetical protein LBU03_00585 [Tannerellaceae bacterium]|nr:hypothetical protein [Tannerellaceae bacterium]